MSGNWDFSSADECIRVLQDKNCSIVDRINALFASRDIGGSECVRVLETALEEDPSDPTISLLLRHEVAYNLGQCGEPSALPLLHKLLISEEEDEIVRHEAAEGIAALDDVDSLPLLRKYLEHPSEPLRQTAELAVRSMEIKHPELAVSFQEGADVPICACHTGDRPIRNVFTSSTNQSIYRSIDPMAPDQEVMALSIGELRERLMSAEEPLWRRYQAMFGIRDKAVDEDSKDECVNALSYALLMDKSSAVLRHELAYVLGQLQSYLSIDALEHCLMNEEEHSMARHEAALALGSVGGESAQSVLCRLVNHKDLLVAESCVVGLDYMGVTV